MIHQPQRLQDDKRSGPYTPALTSYLLTAIAGVDTHNGDQRHIAPPLSVSRPAMAEIVKF
ncbi:MAG: hypothetical protein KDB65_06650 [Calditrichaeota bacterium]|nr:hypothetical protein [Calditrichota bacterium]MCB9369728.1 hypothetical protein [Calditrichota bacterium]